MVTSPLAYPLHWPAELPRTRSSGRSPFKVSLWRAVADLQDSLRLFGADTGMPVRNVVISSNVTLGAARPSDPAVAVYFEWDGARRCVAVDRFAWPEDNVRAIYTILEARRQEMRYGGLHVVRAAFRGFSALPPPRDWRTVLGVGPEADLAAVEAAWREKARAAHPDRQGGSGTFMAELNAARAAARKEIAS
jgi:hypothetical protein